MRNQRGNIGLAVLWMVSLAFFLGGSFLPAVLTQNRLQTRSSGNLAALAVAEAGAELAFWEFRYNPGANQFSAANGWVGFAGSACAAAGNTCPFGNCVCRVYTVSPATAASSSPTGIATITVKDIGWSKLDETKIVSTGVAESSSVSTTVTAVLSYNSSAKPFVQAIFSLGDVAVTGTADVMSYDTSAGLPNLFPPTDCDPTTGTPACSANIESNTGNLLLGGVGTNKAFVNGTAFLDGTVDTTTIGFSRVNPLATSSNYTTLSNDRQNQSEAHDGNTSKITWPAPVDPQSSYPASCITISSNITSSQVVGLDSDSGKVYCTSPSAGLTVATNVTLTIKGTNSRLYVDGALQLSGGGSLDWSGGLIHTKAVAITSSGSQLYIRGKTEFYATGNFDVWQGGDMNNNATISTSRVPDFLRLYIQKSSPSASEAVHITSGTSENYGLIYAPDMAVTIDGGADLHGAIIGKTVVLNGTGSQLFYDISLRKVTDWPTWLIDGMLGGGGTPSIKSWSRSN